MRVIRCIGGAALLALAVLAIPGAGPAVAAAPTVTIDSPAADSVQPSAFAITGSARQDGSNAVITSVEVKLADDDGWMTPTKQTYNGTAGGIFSGGGDTVSFNWSGINSTNVAKYNGPYTVTVTAVGQSSTTLGGTQTQTTVVSKSFHVEIAPSTPTGVSASKPEDSTVATVKWNKNPEPDIAGYDIWRSYQGAAAKHVAAVDASKTSYTDDLAGAAAGGYKYGVYAVRHVRSCKSSNNVDEACSRTKASTQAGQSSSVTVRGQTTTTTSTTIKKSTGGGSSGGSSGGTTPTTAPSGGTSSGGTSSGGTSSGGARTGTLLSVATGGFAPGGEVDLSQFGSLLNPRARPTGGGRVAEPDGTFDETLPYGEQPVKKADGDNNLITIGGASIPQPSDDWVKFIGAGALVTAILVHVLWFKQQVDRLPLEAID